MGLLSFILPMSGNCKIIETKNILTKFSGGRSMPSKLNSGIHVCPREDAIAQFRYICTQFDFYDFRLRIE